MPKDKNARHLRKVRQARVRKKVMGTAERPRLSVFRSLKHIYAQVIDDTAGRTIVSASSQEALQDGDAASPKIAVSSIVGRVVAERAMAEGSDQGGLRPGRLQVPRPGKGSGRGVAGKRPRILAV